jgi:glycosyltransferase involved in cell wall biosynthesis
MRIGVAIPCYIKHITKCLELLDSINAQTRLPDEVVVSCSSTVQDQFPIHEYKFQLQVLTTEERKNSSMNRNIAASTLTTDIICFFDADDLMHPQRLEAIEKAFLEGSDVVLHSYYINKECDQPFPILSDFTLKSNILFRCISGCIKTYDLERIHHGHVSVSKEIYEQLKFPEEHEYQTREDCVFCYRVFSLPNIRSSYIPHPLSKYIGSGSVEFESNNPI